MIYLNLDTKEGREFLFAHDYTRRDHSQTHGSRALLERELGEIMLADKQMHARLPLAANPRPEYFARLPADRDPGDSGRLRPRTASAERDSLQMIAAEAAKCAELWRAVIFQIALDKANMWGVSKADHHAATMFAEGKTDAWREAREELCSRAMIEPDAMDTSLKSGALSEIASKAIGRERWITRMENAQATAVQPDMFGWSR